MTLINGNCLEEMKKLDDKSVDLLICDLPYGETNCKWDIKIDMTEFWLEFKRIRKSKRTACIHFCSTKFGYELIKSWEGGYKMDMVWKKRNKTGGLHSRNRPMRNHEMVYFFYEQTPKYNRDKYHKRIQAENPIVKEEKTKRKTIKVKDRTSLGEQSGIYSIDNRTTSNFEPPNPASVLEEKDNKWIKEVGKNGHGWDKHKPEYGNGFEPPNPASVIETNYMGKTQEQVLNSRSENGKKHLATFDPPNPASILVEEFIEPAEDEPVSMFESTKVFIGKRHHQTEKPQDILEFFLKYWTDEGDVVLDPTMGSGSTGVACKKLNRKFIGIELDETIFEVAKKRCID